jgi:hypothetical protein
MKLTLREEAMPLLIVQHKVSEYTAWRSAFDAHESSRTGATITNERVYRGADNPNDLVLLFDVADVAKAKTWAAGEDLKAAMQNAGVLGAPMITFVP